MQLHDVNDQKNRTLQSILYEIINVMMIQDSMLFIHVHVHQLWCRRLVISINCRIWYFILNKLLWFWCLLNTTEQSLWKASKDCLLIHSMPMLLVTIYSIQWDKWWWFVSELQKTSFSFSVFGRERVEFINTKYHKI